MYSRVSQADGAPETPGSPVAPPEGPPELPRCRHCGCQHFWPVGERRLPTGAVWRRLRCRYCGLERTETKTSVPGTETPEV